MAYLSRPGRRALLSAALGAFVLTTIPRPVRAAEETLEDKVVDAFPIHETRLTNGLRVILSRDTRSPIVAVNLRYTAGSGVEPAEQRGIALLTQYMMRESTLHVPRGGFDRLLARVGATDVGYGTSFDYTRFYATVPSNRLALPLWILSDQMGFLAERVGPALLDQQRRIELNERRERISGRAFGEVPRFVREAVYGHTHPYAASYYGDHGELERVSPQAVIDFFDARFGPEEATLAIVGDFDEDEAQKLVEKYFGPIPRGLGAPLKPPPRPVLQHETRLFVRAHVEHAAVHIAWPIPGILEDGGPELDVASYILDGTGTALLHWKLVDELHLATSVSADIEHLQHGALFEINAEASGAHTAEELLVKIDEVLESARTKTATALALNKAILEYSRPRVFGLERAAYRADQYARYAQLSGSPKSFFRDLFRVGNVTSDGVRSAITTYLPPDRRVVALTSPAVDAPIGGVIARQEER